MTSFTSASTYRRIARPLLIAFFVVGCAETGPAADLAEYVARLERVLEQGSHTVVETQFPRLPPVRELRLEPPQESIDIVEFLQMGRCELQQLVAERNSNLGRLAQPSQRLVYEVNFLRTGGDCHDAIAEDHPELAAELASVLERKREHLPMAIWQATLGGNEFRAFWQPTNATLPIEFEENAGLLLALSQLVSDIRRWKDGDYTIDSSRLERQLDVIRRGSGGVQLQAWTLVENKLSAATQVVRDRLTRRPLCFEDMPTPKADILDSVVRSYFVGRVQAWAASLNARYYEVFPAVREIEASLTSVQPLAYVAWRAERDAFLEEARGALANHVEALQPLLEQCNVMPAGAPP